MQLTPRTILILIALIAVALMYRMRNSQKALEDELVPTRRVRPELTATPSQKAGTSQQPTQQAASPNEKTQPEEELIPEAIPIDDDLSPTIQALQTRMSIASAYEAFRTIGVSVQLPVSMTFEWEPGDKQQSVIGLLGQGTDGSRLAVAAAKTANVADIRKHITQLWDFPVTGWKQTTGLSVQNCRNCFFYEISFGGQKGFAMLGTNAFDRVSYVVALLRSKPWSQQERADFVRSIKITKPQNY